MKRARVYIKKSEHGPNGPEWVVRISGGGGDMAVCGCSGRWEAEFVKQCIYQAAESRHYPIRLDRMLIEIEKDFGIHGLRRPR